MEKILKSMVDKAINQIGEIHEMVSKIDSTSKKPLWLDVPETCRFLKISSRTLQNYRDKGMLPYSQIGSKIYFKLTNLNQFIENHMVNN